MVPDDFVVLFSPKIVISPTNFCSFASGLLGLLPCVDEDSNPAERIEPAVAQLVWGRRYGGVF